MIKLRIKCISFAIFLVLFPWSQSEITATDIHDVVNVVSSTNENLVFEINSPNYQVIQKVFKESRYQILKIPGFSQSNIPGKPQLPVKGVLFGLPVEGKVRLEIINVNTKSLGKFNIFFTPELAQDSIVNERQLNQVIPNVSYNFFKDKQLLQSNQFYPREIVKLDTAVFIRDQKIGRLLFYPIQYNPVTGETRWCKSLKIRITFSHQSKNQITKIPSDNFIFENIFKQTLLNYDQAKHWRKKINPSTPTLLKNVYQGYNGEWFKITINDDGVYHLTKQDLENAGLSVNEINPVNIKIFNKGKEIPIYVYGEQDSVFNDSDFIEFYGVMEKTRFTNDNIYWLTIGESFGLRMVHQDGSLTDVYPIVTKSLYKKHFEINSKYQTSIQEGTEEDHWFWESISAPEQKTINIYLKDVVNIPLLPCKLYIEFRGVSYTPANPDHHTIVSLNDNQLLDVKWDSQIKYKAEVDFQQSILMEDKNVITIDLPGDTDSIIDIILLNWIEIDYWRNFIAVANGNLFTFWGNETPGTYHYEIKDFSTDQIFLFDITDSSDVKKIVNFETEPSGTGYNLIFQDSLLHRHYLAITSDLIKKPAAIVKDNISQLRSVNNQADYIIITHEMFYDRLTPLANLRQNQGLNVVTVKVDDIYDEFNYGIKSPQAIKDFLSYAYYYWKPPSPTYVLLIGDASYDYKNYLENSLPDLVPTHLFESNVLHTETSTDNWFVCVSGEDNLPDMLIGRFPVRIFSYLSNIINKIIGYEINPYQGNWNENILMVADNADKGGDFEKISDYFAEKYIPENFNVSKVYVRDFGNRDNVKAAIIQELNKGCLVTNYLGHGSPDTWASEKIFTDEDIIELNNMNKLPVVVTMCCMNGYFHHSVEPYSLAEELINTSKGGAIASFSPSGFGYTQGDIYLGEGFYSALFQDNDNILGSVITRAKISIFSSGISYRDHIDFYNLFGDPALKIDIPPQSIPITSQWNLISLPRQPEIQKVDSVLSTLKGKWQKLMTYSNGMWIGADTQVPANFWTLTEMSTGQGYWLQTTDEGQIQLNGSEKSSIIPLSKGWNLIGYPTTFTQDILDALKSIEENWSKIVFYTDGIWLGADASLPPSLWTMNELKPGAGYWLKMNSEDTLLITRVPYSNDNVLPTNNPNTPLSPQTLVERKNQQKIQFNLDEHYKLTVPMPSGYYGFIKIKDKPAPEGTKIAAMINNTFFPPEIQVSSAGKYHLMLVSGDDPLTQEIEGGKQNDIVSFKITLPNGDTFISDTKGIWEEGVNHRLNLFAQCTPDSESLPVKIQFLVDEKLVGEHILNGDPIRADARISALVISEDINIIPENIQLYLNSEKIESNRYIIEKSQENTDLKCTIIFPVDQISSGIHTLSVQVTNVSMMPNTVTADYTFKISTELQLQKIVNFPNPMQKTTKFTYCLINDIPPEVTIKIYTVSGRLIKVIHSASNKVGYNETFWDGIDEFGDPIANGVYFYKIIAKDDKEKIEAIEKLVKME